MKTHLSRRRFLGILGGGTAGISMGGLLTGCGGEGGGMGLPDGLGEIHGQIYTLSGEPSATGRIFLMYQNGMQTGRYTDPDEQGGFIFHNVEPGDYQLRFQAPGVARVPAQFDNPVRVTVPPNGLGEALFRIEVGEYDDSMIEIYMGDNFFQRQPYGDVNARTTVKVGTAVCWYHVGQHPHDVVGEPWGSSPEMHRGASFIWVANEIGLFQYLCSYHSTVMRAELEVVA